LKKIGSKVFKVFLCLILIFIFSIVKPKQEAEAVAPLLAWGASIIGGLVLDYAIDMGMEWVDEQAKTKWKDNIVGKILNKHGDKIKDLKPTKKNGLKWLFKAPKWLVSIIMDTIRDSMEDVATDDKKRKDTRKKKDGSNGYENLYEITTESTDPFYETGVCINSIGAYDGGANLKDKKFAAYLNEWVNYKLTPVSYAKASKLEISANKDFSNPFTVYISGDEPCRQMNLYADFEDSSDSSKAVLWSVPYSSSSARNILASKITETNQKYYSGITVSKSHDLLSGGFKAFEKYLELLQTKNQVVLFSDGVLATDGYKGYLNLPDGADTDSVIEWTEKSKDLPPSVKDREFEFEADITLVNQEFQTIQEGDEFDWELVLPELQAKGDSIYNISYEYDYSPTINNTYIITENQQTEINNEVVGSGDDGDGDGDGSGGSASKLDRSLLSYVKNAYEYADDTIDTAVDGLKDLGNSAKKIVEVYKVFFGWLPTEFQTLMYSSLAIMVGLRLFRK